MSKTKEQVIEQLNKQADTKQTRIQMLIEAKNHLPITDQDTNTQRRFRILNIKAELEELIEEAKQET